jgi:5-methylcytosine-specific restriction protein B
MAWFFGGKARRKEHDIPNLWALFEAAMAYADYTSAVNRSAFMTQYDKVISQHGIRWNLTNIGCDHIPT